jgi:hypothetical protein
MLWLEVLIHISPLPGRKAAGQFPNGIGVDGIPGFSPIMLAP